MSGLDLSALEAARERLLQAKRMAYFPRPGRGRGGMTGLLICAAVVAWCGCLMCAGCGVTLERGDEQASRLWGLYGLALIAVALWLAYAAGAQP